MPKTKVPNEQENQATKEGKLKIKRRKAAQVNLKIMPYLVASSMWWDNEQHFLCPEGGMAHQETPL